MTIVGYGWKVERCSYMLVNANLTHESCLTGLATKHKTDDNATLLLEYRWICHSYPNQAKPTICTCLHWTHYIHWFIFTVRPEHRGSSAGYPHVCPPCSNVWLITPLEKFQQKTLCEFLLNNISYRSLPLPGSQSPFTLHYVSWTLHVFKMQYFKQVPGIVSAGLAFPLAFKNFNTPLLC